MTIISLIISLPSLPSSPSSPYCIACKHNIMRGVITIPISTGNVIAAGKEEDTPKPIPTAEHHSNLRYQGGHRAELGTPQQPAI